ncbi:hypothetical protein WJX74_009160 [Apatococcus lobatus]|uniref:Uncharacterized protein n=1 Tax=Apatococcus lobatus TaxID=904363 RepID=A0AAW1R3J6_9CHLO
MLATTTVQAEGQDRILAGAVKRYSTSPLNVCKESCVRSERDLLLFIHTGLEAKQHQSLLPAPAKNATAHLLR